MTNEEIAEEIYYQAFELGFIDLLREKVGYIYKTTHVKDHSDVVQKAYNLLVTEGLIQL
jgi:hypothetical protein